MPTFVIWGDADHLLHVSGAQYIEDRIVNGAAAAREEEKKKGDESRPPSGVVRTKVIILPGKGHSLLMEAAETVAGHFGEFLQTD